MISSTPSLVLTMACDRRGANFDMMLIPPSPGRDNTLSGRITRIYNQLETSGTLYLVGADDEHCAKFGLKSALAEAKARYHQKKMSRHPALQTTGLSSVAEDPNNVTPTERTAEREDRKLAMLRRMRPPPLKYAWNFYFDKHTEGSSYENRLTLMKGGIVTLKPFWSTINNFPMAGLNMKDSVHFFKRGIKPVWEDSRNINGGCWIFRVQKAKSEQFWVEVLMLAIGEQFAPALQPCDDICGLTFSVRFKSNLISIWNRDGSNQRSIENILNVVLDKLSLELKPSTSTDKKEYYYKKHSEHAGYEEVVAGAKEAARQKLAAHEAKEAAKEAEASQEEEDKNEAALVTEEEGNEALLKDHGGDEDVNKAMMEQTSSGNGLKQSSGLREEVHADEP